MANTATLQDVLDRYTDLTANETTAITKFYNAMVDEGLWPRFVDIFFFSLLTEENARIGALRWEFNRTLGVATHIPGQGFTFESGASLYQVHNQGNSYKSSDLGAVLDTEFGSTNHGMGHKVTRLVEDPANAHVDYFGSSSDGGTTIRQHEGSTRLQAQVGSNANYRFLGALPYTYTPQHLVFDRRGDGNIYYWDSLGKFEFGPEPAEDPLNIWRDDRPIFINGRATSPSGSVNAHESDHEFHYVFHQDGTLDDKAFATIDLAFIEFIQDVNAPISKTVLQNFTPTWQVLNFVSNDYQTSWNVIEAVSNDLQVDWSLLNFVPAEYQSVWNNLNFVSADYESVWNIAGVVSADYQPVWNNLEWVSADYQSVWHNLDFVSQDYQTAWNVVSGIISALNVSWNVSGRVSQNYQADWHVLNFIHQDHTTVWNVSEYLTAEYNSAWNVAGFVTGDYTSTWHNLNVLSQDHTFAWDVQSDLLAASIQFSWNVESLSGTTPSRIFRVDPMPDRQFELEQAEDNQFGLIAEDNLFHNTSETRRFAVTANGILQD